MNRIEKYFNDKNNIVGYITAGYPNIETTEKAIYKMVESGVNLLEIGIPFSDPNAEGEVVHNANLKSLENGMRLEKAFDLVEKVRKEINIPIIFYTYCNPVFAYGYDKFFGKCNEIGVDGLFIPDLPYEEFEEMENIAEENNVFLTTIIFLFSSQERIEKLAKRAKGFIYLIPIPKEDGKPEDLSDTIQFIKSLTNIPIIIDAVIEDEQTAKFFSEIADGIKIGLPIIGLIDKDIEKAPTNIYKYIKNIKNSL